MLKLTSLLTLLLFTCFWHAAEARADAVIDPTGDTFGAGSVRHDMTSVNATFAGSSLTFTVNFAGQIYAPSALNARSVYGFIDIDADRNPATGAEPFVNIFGPGPVIALGDEFALDLFSEEFQAGRVDVLNAVSDVVGTAPITFGANAFSVTVPLALLGGSNGLINYGVVVGTFGEATDRAPNGTLPATSTPVPEPATMLLLGTGLAAVGARLRKTRGHEQR